MRSVISSVATICWRRCRLVVSSLFWFYPLVWWIGARLVDERERACDERVLARSERPAVYAESILKTCEICIASPLANVAGVTGGLLKTRIVRIMKNAPLAPLGVRKKTVLVLAAALALLVPIVSGAGSRVAASAVAQDSDREVHRPGGRITTPRLIREVKPQYPERAKQDKVQGEVLMECVVKADGTVGDKKVVRSLRSRPRPGGVGCRRAMVVRARNARWQTRRRPRDHSHRIHVEINGAATTNRQLRAVA